MKYSVMGSVGEGSIEEAKDKYEALAKHLKQYDPYFGRRPLSMVTNMMEESVKANGWGVYEVKELK